MGRNNKKIPFSVNLQISLKRILKDYNISGLTHTFNVFFNYFEKQLNYLYYECGLKNGLKNTSINVPKERLDMLNNLVNVRVFISHTEAIRFIFLNGICELQKGNKKLLDFCLNKNYNYMDTEEEIEETKEEQNEKKKLKKILSKVISIEEYNNRKKVNEIGK